MVPFPSGIDEDKNSVELLQEEKVPEIITVKVFKV